jgi:cytochrome c553
MAAGMLPKPGTKFGPCKKSCQHKDCEQTRADAAAMCGICHEAIGYGRLFYREGSGLVHELCAAQVAEHAQGLR